MSRKSIIICLLGASVGLLGWSSVPPALPGSCEVPAPTDPALSPIVVARDRGLGSIAAGRNGRGPDVAVIGVARHVASAPGRVAFVDDLPGADDLVVAIGGETTRLHEGSEVLHPSWSPSGALVWSIGDGLRLRRSSGTIRTIDAPPGAGLVFSPTFDPSGAVVAVVEPTTVLGAAEDDRGNELWRFDRSSARWDRLTNERIPSGRWIAIRTLVTAPDGSLQYVRISGSDRATEPPSFELWRLVGERASRIRALPSERYLAGFAGGRRLWNVFDARIREWVVGVEGADGRTSMVGCGRISVDPRTGLDPDRSAELADPGAPLAPPTPPTLSPSTTPTIAPTSVPMPTPAGSADPDPDIPTGPAILIGDFATLEQAEATSARIAAGSAEGIDAEVIDSSVAPAVIQPGVWGVVVPVAAGADPEALLQAFRARFPDLAPWTWVVTV